MIQFNDDLCFITTIAMGMDGVVIIDEDQIIVLFNQYAEKMFGYHEEDILGKPLNVLLPPDLSKRHRQHVKNFMTSGVVGRPMAERQTIHGRHASGHDFAIEASISHTTYNGRRYCTAVLRDLTPMRKKLETLQNSKSDLEQRLSDRKLELQAATSRLSEVQRLSQIGLWELNLIENTLYWSPEVFEIFEIDRNSFQASYEAFLDAIHPEDRDMVNKVYTESVSNKKPYQIRHRLLMKDDRVKYVEERCETFYNTFNEPVRSVGTIQDITSHIVAEQHRRHLQNLLLRVETLAEIGSWEWNLDTNKFYWSPQTYRQYGFDPEKVNEPEFVLALNSLHPEDRQRVEDHLLKAKSCSHFEPIEYRVIRSTGELRHMRVLGEIIKGNRFEPDRMYGFVQDITNYVIAEREIRESNQLLEAVFDTTHVCIAYLDKNMNFIRVNRAYAAADHKSPDFFIGKNHFKLYPHAENEKLFRNAVTTGEPVIVNAKPFESAFNPERGITHWDWTLSPIQDDNGCVKALVLSLLEVTERINAIEALQRNEDQLEMLNENLENIIADRTLQLEDERNFIDTVLEIQGALVIVLDRNACIVRFNRACENATGYKFDELRGKPVWDFLIPHNEIASVKQVFTGLSTAVLPFQFENHWLTKDGYQRLIQWSNSIMTDHAGDVRFVIATGIDITERRKTEKKLQQSETSLQAAQRIAKVGSWEMDAQTGKLWWSDENYRIFGLNPGQFEPSLEAYYESIHPDDLPTAKAAAIKLAEQGHIDIINRILLPSGEQRIVREIAETETDADGRPLVMRGTVHDITELKQSEEERNQLQRQLQQAQKMESIGHLTGGIAHDFNNILASILGFTQLAITRFAPNREGTLGNYLSEIEKGGKRASDLVKQMLAFSRGDTQGHTILNPHPILIESVKMLRSTIPSSITLNYKPPGFDIRIQTDALQLQQAVVNLIINARDSLEGKGRIEVIFKSAVINSVECSSCHKLFSGNYAGVFVKDNGSGIAKEIIPRIFEPFFTTKKIGQGSGMGLALVHGFVHASGGHVGIETGIDSGTTMKLYFPLCDFDTDSSHGNASPLFGDSLARNGDTIKILVVDDEEAIVKLVSEILEIHNYQVVSTTSSKQALKTLTDSPDEFAVLVTDQAMPDLSGVDLIHEIRKNNTKIPIIICTGYSDIVNEFNFAEKGASRFLAKPVWHDELLKVVSELIDGLKTH